MSNPTTFPEKVNRRESRRVSDDVLQAAIFFFPKDGLRSLAARIGISPNWLAERLKSPELQQRIADQRAATFGEAMQLAESRATASVQALATIIDSPESSNRDKIAAVRVFAEISAKLFHIVRVAPALARLEAEIYRLTNGAHDTDNTDGGSSPVGELPAAGEVIEMPSESPDQYASAVIDRLRDMLAKFEGTGG